MLFSAGGLLNSRQSRQHPRSHSSARN